jgi:hypothetical protein
MLALKNILSFVFVSSIFLNCSKIEDFKSNDAINKGVSYRIKTKLTLAESQNFTIDAPQTIVNAGRICIEGDYLFIGEWGLGIHVFDNTIPTKPIALAFLSIPASTDYFVKNDVLIVDNGNDLVSLKIDALDKLKKKENTFADLKRSLLINKRTAEVFVYPNYPIQQNVYFQCPVKEHFVVAWEKGEFSSIANCYR